MFHLSALSTYLLHYHSHKFPMEASHKAYCFTKMPLVSFWLDLGFFFQLFLKLDIKAQLLRCYLASPNQTIPPAHSFEIFQMTFEDVPGKFLLWGNKNLSSPIKYLAFDII